MIRLAGTLCTLALGLGGDDPPRALLLDTVATPLGTQLDSALRSAEQRGFSGVVRVERDGRLLLRKGYGVANRSRRIPFSDATVVQIGSNTKDFTLVALLRLQQRGELSLRDSLGRFFPDAPADKRGITLQQLVDHRGGLPIGLGGDFDMVTRDQLLTRVFAVPLRAQPGTREIYSNTGYALLAAVIERVTGKSYDAHVRDDVLVPLGLEDTGYLLPRFDPDRVAHGYRRGDDQGNILLKPHAADGPYWNLRGNGGMVSTVEDMHAFYRALFDGERVLSRGARGNRFDPTEPVALAGSDLVHFFLFERLPADRLEIIVATNSAEAPAPLIRDAIAPLLGLPRSGRAGGDTPAPPPAGARPPEPAVATLIRDVLAAVNAADSTALTRFVTERFAQDGGPTVEQRTQRLRQMHDNLGTLTLASMWVETGNAVHVSATTGKEGPATLIFDVTAEPVPKIRTVRVMVGG